MSRRQPIRFVPLALLLPVALSAQTPARRHVDVPAVAPRAADVATVDGIVKAYYDVITGPAGQPRQWSRDRSLYISDLRFVARSEEHTSELQSHSDLVCRLLLE